MAKIKFLNVIDRKIDYEGEIIAALGMQQDTYRENGVDIEYQFKHIDMPNFWNDKGNINHVTIREVLKDMPEAYTAVFIIHPDNWHDKDDWVSGWHLGKYGEYQVQLIQAYGGNTTANYRTLMMEGMHSWDTPIWDKLKINLSKYFGVRDYDYTILHGMFHQGETLSQEESMRIFGEGYVQFDYAPLIKKLAPLLSAAFNEHTMKLVIKGTEQYLRGKDGKDRHIYNKASLLDYIDAGIIENTTPEKVEEINPIGRDWISLEQE